MAGIPRKLSNSGFYHIIIKGNNGRIIFEHDDDRRTFLSLMRKQADRHLIKYHAWCLMDNHVHLLVEDQKREISQAIAELSRGYTEYFRQKYGYEGTLYTGRFWSESVESEAYILCAVRYIHQNPQTAGICHAFDYPWSSIGEYLGSPTLCSTELMLNLCGGCEGFKRFHEQQLTVRSFPGSRLRNHMRQEEILGAAKAVAGTNNIVELPRMRVQQRNPVIWQLHEAGFTYNQIARISGLSNAMVHRIVAQVNLSHSGVR